MMEMKINFKDNHTDLKRKLGYKEMDDQKHLFECDVLLNNCGILARKVRIEYGDIFSENLRKQRNAIRLITQILSTRKNLL